MQQFGKEYAMQMVKNAQTLASMLKTLGIEVLAEERGFTKSNVLLIRGDSVGGHQAACHKLYDCHIATNSRHGFGEEVIRVGVQEVTRRGMKEEEMETIALFFKKALIEKKSSRELKEEIKSFTKNNQEVHFSFDKETCYC